MFSFDPTLLDPTLANLLFTGAVCTFVVGVSAMALSMLPWSDEELSQVDQAAGRWLFQVAVPVMRRVAAR